ncbi:MAG: hypothetical protein ACLT8V_05815, partial [Streptococcus salivarius]
TKAAMTLVPEIKGYKADKTGVTPSNPGEDTKVVYKLVNAEPAKPAVNKEVGTIVVIYRDEYGNQIKMPLVITNSVGADVNLHGDRYIYRNGVKYELIRQEGKSTDKMTEGQTVVTTSTARLKMVQHLQLLMVEAQLLKLLKQLQTVLKDLRVQVQQLMVLQTVKVQIRRNLEIKMVRRQMVLIKLRKAMNNCQ